MACVWGASLTPAWAAEPFTVKDIRVEGLQRTDAGTVFATLPFRMGDDYTDDKGAAALRALFASGLFKDVRIDLEDGVVVVRVEERPIVSSIEFVGAKEFDKDVLLRALKDFGIAEGQAFDRALADKAEQELKRQYLARSLYGVTVQTEVTPRDANQVGLRFTVIEGEVAKIQNIRIHGAKAFSESRLKSLFELNDGGWMNWYSKADRYARNKLNADLDTLKAFYQNRGYLEFEIVSTEVAMSPDKQGIDIDIRLREGQAYTVSDIRLSGDYLGKDDEFKTLIQSEAGDAYDAQAFTETVRQFVDRFGAFGYAFARIEPRTELDREKGWVAITLDAQPMQRVYVRRIHVAGNSRTRDEVIRREFRQFESSWYDGRKIKLSRDRVDRLGYFSEVDIETVEVPGAPDQVDLQLTVKEKPTGNLQIGAGFSTADKISLSGAIKQENVFGTGNYLGIDLNTSKSQRTLVLSTVDPYFTVDGVSRSYDLSYRVNRPMNTDQGEDYQIVTPGASVRFGIPFSEFDTVFVGVGWERTQIRGEDAKLPSSYVTYRQQYGAVSDSIPVTVGWQRDERDSAIAPTDGRYLRTNLDWGAAGDVQYLRLNAQGQQFFALTRQISLGLNAEVGLGKGLSARPYPFFKNFYAGGLGTVRAFEQGSLGPVDANGSFVGGNKRANFNAELYLPMPGTGSDRSLRWFTYFDVGNVWGVGQWPKVGDLRASAGVGLSWLSPVGPLKLSYGTPIRKLAGDKIQRLQFQIGTAF